jgi:hypothetical protein
LKLKGKISFGTVRTHIAEQYLDVEVYCTITLKKIPSPKLLKYGNACGPHISSSFYLQSEATLKRHLLKFKVPVVPVGSLSDTLSRERKKPLLPYDVVSLL